MIDLFYFFLTLLFVASPLLFYSLLNYIDQCREEALAKNRFLHRIWSTLKSMEDSPEYMRWSIRFLQLLESKHSLSEVEDFYIRVCKAKANYDAQVFQNLMSDLDEKSKVKRTVKISELLGLGNDFTKPELKKAYRAWMMKNHPDKNPNANLETVQKVTSWYNRNKVA